MNIIFGSELTEQIQTRYTILELDTFNLLPSDQVKTAYCLIQFIPIEEMIEIQSLKDLHSNLMAEYRKRNWRYCEDVIEHLTGKWGGEVDTFYSELYQRIQQLKKQNLDLEWNGIIVKQE
jgi:hypothetical protein